MDNTSSSVTQSRNPATGEVLGESPLHGRKDLLKAVERASEAQKIWVSWPLSERVESLCKVRDYLVANKETLAEVIAADNGKTRMDAMLTEVLAGIMAVSYYCGKAKHFLRDRSTGMGSIVLLNKRSREVRVPYGVIGIVSPWNYPFAIPFSEVVMGLLAGNGVILKCATETQQVGLAMKRAFEAAELPEDLFFYLNMPGREAGDALLESEIDKLFFTGSVPVGKKIMAKAAETLTPVCLELGGNDAMIVCRDADLNRAAEGAVWAGFQNAGQSCGGVERIYVDEEVHDSFLKILKEKTEALRVGYDRDHAVDMGVMTTERQLETVRRHVESALSDGAEVYARSAAPDDPEIKNVHPAIVLTGVTHEMDVMKEETFGPVVGVMPFDSVEEAVELANDSNLGLSASVWSSDRRKARRIARKIRAGSVTINDHLMSHGLAETAWGGFKESGIGRTHGELGFNEMTQPQMIVDDLLSFTKRGLWWHPFSPGLYRGIRGIADMLYGVSFGKRIRGTLDLLKVFPRIFR